MAITVVCVCEHSSPSGWFNPDSALKKNYWYPLVMTNIAMENGPFVDGLPIKNGDFP